MARQLVRQRNHRDIRMDAAKQAPQPRAEGSAAARQGRQAGPRPLDQVLAQILAAALGDSEQLRPAAPRGLAVHEPEPSGKIAPAAEGPRVTSSGDTAQQAC